MSQPDSNSALVPVQSSALAIGGSPSLAKRGLGDLQLLERAEAWFQRALDLSTDAELEESHKCLLHVVELDPFHVNALLWLGSDFQDGVGTDSNLWEAVNYFRRAAGLGSSEGKHQIAYLFMNGSGSPEVPPDSESYFRKYAEEGNPCAQWVLGKIFGTGYKVATDYQNAAHWYRRAAEQGYAHAQRNLGEMYAHGQGMTKDYAQAAYWYRKAAEQGDAEAQSYLGYLFYWGYGVPEDLGEAEYWFSLAAKQRLKDADIMRDLCKAGVTHSAMQKLATERK